MDRSSLFIQFVVIASLVLLSFAAGKTQAEPQDTNRVVDDEGSLKARIDILCSGPTARISKQSTILELAKSLHQDENRKLWPEDCLAHYEKPLEKLDEMLTDKELGVCSFKHINRMANFNWDHVIGSVRPKWSSSLVSPAPKPLRYFFMNYAVAVSKVCELNLLDNLQSAASELGTQSHGLALDRMDSSMKQLRHSLVDKENMRNLDDFTFIWQTIINKVRRKGEIRGEMVDHEGDLVCSLIKVKDATEVWEAQRQCRHQLRPIYQETVLPVMMLIDMGYGGWERRGELSNSQLLRDWYSITQSCELILPVIFLEDPQLKEGDSVRLTELKQIKGLGRQEFTPRSNIPGTKKISKLEVEDKLELQPDRQIVDQWLSSLKLRSHLYKNIFHNVFSMIWQRFTSQLMNFLPFVKSKELEFSPIEDERKKEILKESIEEGEKFIKEDDSEIQSEMPVSRRKRETNALMRQKREADSEAKAAELAVSGEFFRIVKKVFYYIRITVFTLISAFIIILLSLNSFVTVIG